MAKQAKTPVNFVDTDILSFDDAGYRFAMTGDTRAKIARWIVDQCPDFVDNAPEEVLNSVTKGIMLRWQELNPAQTYNQDWVPMEGGSVSATLANAMSYSQQAFGQLRAANPAQHKVIGEIRTKFNKYKSNVINSIKAEIKKLQKPASEKRDQAKAYDVWLKETIDSLKSRAKTAKARGDGTVIDEAKLSVAIKAFWEALK